MRDPVVLDPEGLVRRLEEYREWLKFNHFAELTVRIRTHHLQRLLGWCADRGITRPAEITKPILERYQQYLFHYRKKNGEPLSLGSQMGHMVSVKMFFKWLARSNHTLYNPASELLIPRMQRALPKEILTEEEAERVINQADVETLVGIRDRAIMETLYSTGMRRMEAVGLRLYDVDAERGTVMIRRGKGGKQRVVPIGDRALGWIRKYLYEVRSRFVVEPDAGYLFVGHRGEAPMIPNTVTELVRCYLDKAEIRKRGAAHLFRHACATLMLEGGADIRFIQAMLGHASLDMTQIYTQVSIQKLKEIHTATHPAKLKGAEIPIESDKKRQEYKKRATAAVVPPPAPPPP